MFVKKQNLLRVIRTRGSGHDASSCRRLVETEQEDLTFSHPETLTPLSQRNSQLGVEPQRFLVSTDCSTSSENCQIQKPSTESEIHSLVF